MAAHREPDSPAEDHSADLPRPTLADLVREEADAGGKPPAADDATLSRRERRGAATPSRNASKVKTGRGHGVAPNPRQYSTRRRGG
ncbi:MAG: hypothetical protein ACRDRZ_19075 [Pseudonocardiaceae bacterium]